MGLTPSFAQAPGSEVEVAVPTQDCSINMGPQHPATHGVMRLLLKADGEVLTGAQAHLGYLHRCAEKIGENVDWTQYLPYTDRYDYLSAMNNNLGYSLAVEKLMGLEVPERAQWMRVLLAELNRIASHLFAVGTYGLDLGAFTPLFYTLREREEILDLFQEICGARLTCTFIRPGGLFNDAPEGWLEKVESFLCRFEERWKEYDALLLRNKIFIERTAGIGTLSGNDAVTWGVTGPLLRASGVDWDLRRDQPYLVYDQLDFEVPLGVGRQGEVGDCWDRTEVRMSEMLASLSMIRQCLDKMPDGAIQHPDAGPVLRPAPGRAYVGVENPRGELGHWLVSDGTKHPVRVRMRSPSFCNLSVVEHLLPGAMLGDAAAILGSIDIVVGETDR